MISDISDTISNISIKVDTVSLHVGTASIATSNLNISDITILGAISSDDMVVVVPIPYGSKWGFFCGKYAQIGSGYGLGGYTNKDLTFTYYYV